MMSVLKVKLTTIEAHANFTNQLLRDIRDDMGMNKNN